MNDLVTNPFGGDRSTPQSTGALQMQARENTEVMAMAAMAKRFPRDQIKAADKIRNAFTRVSLASKAQYEYARGGTEITGPSIRAAEAISQCWGNMSNGWREVSRSVGPDGVGVSEVEAFSIDFESTGRESIQFVQRHWRDTKRGGYALKDERDVYELLANQAQRRKRACILAQIPGDVTEMAMEQVAVTLVASADVTPESVGKVVEAFAEFNVTKEQIEKRIQRRIDAIRPAQVLQLRRIYASLRDDMSEPADWFAIDTPEPASTGIDAVRAAAAAAAAKKTAPAKKTPAPRKGAPVDQVTGEIGSADDPSAGADSASTATPQAIIFDEAAFELRLQGCKDIEVLDLLIDEVRDLPDGDMKDRIAEVYRARRAALE